MYFQQINLEIQADLKSKNDHILQITSVNIVDFL